jgi:hypothetical protein
LRFEAPVGVSKLFKIVLAMSMATVVSYKSCR